MMVAAVLAAAPLPKAKLPTGLDLTKIRAIPVQHDGRWPPLDTLARDVVESATGDAFYAGHDPVLLLLAWTLDSQTWMREPLISVKSAELRGELQLSSVNTVFSYADLINHRPLRNQIQHLAHRERGRKLNPLESKVSDINEKLSLLQDVFTGRALKPIPDPNDALGAWRAIVSLRRKTSDGADPVRTAWADLKKPFLADDGPAFTAASDRLAAALQALPAAHRPDPRVIETELRYNEVRPYRLAWIIMLVGAGLALGAVIIRRKWFDAIAILGMLAGFAMLTYGLSLRWQIAGRIPAANMFESLLFLSWGMGAFAIVAMIFLRHRVVPLTASAMGALSLILADCLPIDHYIRPIAPVLLDTVWMSIHVPVIMVSYSVLTLAVLIAHVQLVVMAAAPARRALVDAIDSLHYWYVYVGSFLLLAGIMTGSMWAASSWGRYWGWDPKEVWSLVAFVGYLTILHVRIGHERVPRWAYVVAAVLAIVLLTGVAVKLAPLTGQKLLAFAGVAAAMVLFTVARGQFATALKSVLAFWLIIMTYVGVNYVLGVGLHSYGFGTGAVVHYLFIIGGIDLALIAISSFVYIVRSGLARPGRADRGSPYGSVSPA